MVLGGWLLVLADGDRYVRDAVLRPLSARGPLVACFVEEHVMHSQAVAWADGARRWSVLHDQDRGDDHLFVEGAPPPELAAIAAGARAGLAEHEREGQRSSFDVPVDLAESLVGFRCASAP